MNKFSVVRKDRLQNMTAVTGETRINFLVSKETKTDPFSLGKWEFTETQDPWVLSEVSQDATSLS